MHSWSSKERSSPQPIWTMRHILLCHCADPNKRMQGEKKTTGTTYFRIIFYCDFILILQYNYFCSIVISLSSLFEDGTKTSKELLDAKVRCHCLCMYITVF